MTKLNEFSKLLGKKQGELKNSLLKEQDHQKAIDLFLSHHASLHSAEVAKSEIGSYFDGIVEDLTEKQLRKSINKDAHSIVWLIWHLARIEDVTMNFLVAGEGHVLDQKNWFKKLDLKFRHTGNLMSESEIIELSNTVNVKALFQYRNAVARRTREIAQSLTGEDLKKKVDPANIQKIREAGAVLPEAEDLLSYWGRKNFTGLLLMPATRHIIVHLNEAFRIRQKLIN